MLKINFSVITTAFSRAVYTITRALALLIATLRKGHTLTRRQAEQVSYKHHFKNRHMLARRYAR